MATGFLLAVTGLDELLGILTNLQTGAARASAISVSVGTDAPVAAYVTYGTRPHTITARNARALHWTSAGGEFFARSVQHPGTKANPFMEEALVASEGAVRTLVDDAFTEIAIGGSPTLAVAAIEEAGALVAKAAKAKAPVRTGSLRDSITSVVSGRLP
jgi:hypothetical protein